MVSLRGDAAPISDDEHAARLAKAQSLMRERGIDAMYLDASTSLYYFTGLRLHPSERLHGAVLPAQGPPIYLCPAFELAKTEAMVRFPGPIEVWEEHEDPTALVIDVVRKSGKPYGKVAVDETTPFFTFDGLRRAGNAFDFVNAGDITGRCRMHKSPAEIALMQAAKRITLEAHKAAARILSRA